MWTLLVLALISIMLGILLRYGCRKSAESLAFRQAADRILERRDRFIAAQARNDAQSEIRSNCVRLVSATSTELSTNAGSLNVWLQFDSDLASKELSPLLLNYNWIKLYSVQTQYLARGDKFTGAALLDIALAYGVITTAEYNGILSAAENAQMRQDSVRNDNR